MSSRLALASPALVALTLAANARPNILFMVSDDLGGTDVGWRGSEFPTPNIDALAYDGIRLENYYVQQVCSPSRTAFMTGRYPLHTGFNHIVIWQDVVAAIDFEHPTIAEVLRDEFGYKSSYLLGKWHNGHAAWNNTPPGRGFEGGWFGWNGGSSDYYNHTIAAQAPKKSSHAVGYTMFDGLGARSGKPNPAGPPDALPVPAWSDKGNYSTEIWADAAADLIRSHDFVNEPFFMYLGFQSPHAPLQWSPDPELNKRCQELTRGEGRDVFCSMVSYMDRKVGDVVSALKERDQYDNTLIIFSSDNGGAWPAENAGCNFPMRGGKHHLFEGGVRVTGFVSGGRVPAAARGSTSHALMHATDWFPTILSAIGGEKTPRDSIGFEIDGVDLWPALINVSNLNTSTIDPSVTYSPRDEIPHNVDPMLHAEGMTGEPQGAVRLGTYKLVVGDLDIGWRHCNMSLENPTSAQSTQGALNRTFLLFDLLQDPNERRDLSGSSNPEHRAALQRILARWEYWKGETVPPNYPDSDPRSYPFVFSGIYNGSWAPWLDAIRPY